MTTDATGQVDPRWDFEQALASGRIEGHIPTAQFLADCEAVIAGTMGIDDAIAASMKLELAADYVADGVTGGSCLGRKTWVI